jgi:hypothetical protein
LLVMPKFFCHLHNSFCTSKPFPLAMPIHIHSWSCPVCCFCCCFLFCCCF